jgi:nitroreductase
LATENRTQDAGHARFNISTKNKTESAQEFGRYRGLFSMSLLYALEAYGLAACPLNAMFNLAQDRQTRELLNMPDYEFPVMYIAVGNFPESVPVCRFRRTPESIVTRV